MDVTNVDQDVSYVAMVVHVCKRLFTMFHLCFSDVCCECVYLDVAYVFTHMLQMFYLNVVHVCDWFQVCFQVFFYKCFKSMFQVFHLSSDVCCKCCIWMFQK
jgi:hypothetical protein